LDGRIHTDVFFPEEERTEKNQMKNSSVFDRSGHAALSDLKNDDWKKLVFVLEKEQSAFLEKEKCFRSPEYNWPSTPLHTWSRIWEYPYVYHHLQAFKNQSTVTKSPIALDLGSGVTFFPFAVAKLGYKVICVDIDAVCQQDMTRAIRALSRKPYKIEFRLIQNNKLPLSDGEVDVVYCISVIEHISDFEQTIKEIHRVLKPNGLLLMTIDLDLRGDQELGIESYNKLLKSLLQDFEYVWPPTNSHPRDLLRSDNSPYPIKSPKGINLIKFASKQYVARPLLGRKPNRLVPFLLAVEGLALSKTRRPG
jgi:2-polyprenyl-3-methyl-5-hydroxy-6-metoxy-1,4-benzoquinol methylase